MPAFFADVLISVLASSISARTSVDMSAIALCTSSPTDGSWVPVARLDAALWATTGSLRSTVSDRDRAGYRPVPRARPPAGPRRERGSGGGRGASSLLVRAGEPSPYALPLPG